VLKINNIMRRATRRYIFFFATIGLSCQSDHPGEHAAVVIATPVHQETVAERPLVDTDYLLGKFDPATHPDFVAVAQPYTDKPGMMLRKESFQAFETMWKAAQKEGIVLKIISATRNFEQQKRIWEGKWARFEKEAPKPKDRALKILEYSSMPGSSRHHWGTDIDLNDLNNATFEKDGKYEKVYAWLKAHAHEYGFCQPYTAGRPTGYHEEKWHWSYTPLSKGFLEAYKNNLNEANISGFKGSETAVEIGIVKNYVLGINEECK
jgi:zinc D-Ala-D-Ala carboxypeptidase